MGHGLRNSVFPSPITTQNIIRIDPKNNRFLKLDPLGGVYTSMYSVKVVRVLK